MLTRFGVALLLVAALGAGGCGGSGGTGDGSSAPPAAAGSEAPADDEGVLSAPTGTEAGDSGTETAPEPSLREIRFDLTDPDGWHYQGTVPWPTQTATFSKDITSSPPGTARLLVSLEGDEIEPLTFSVDNEGRSGGPDIVIRPGYFSYPVPDASGTSGSPDVPDSVGPCSLEGNSSYDFQPFDLGFLCPSGSDAGAADEDGTETWIDRVISQSSGAEPVYVLDFGGIGPICNIFVMPDGTVDLREYKDDAECQGRRVAVEVVGGDATTADGAQCPRVQVFSAVGSGNRDKASNEVVDEVTEVFTAGLLEPERASGAGEELIRVEPVDYPAVSVRSPTGVGASLRFGGAYHRSVVAGKDALRARLDEFMAECGDSQVVLTGFSQGAQVVGDVYQELEQAGGPRLEQVAGVVLFGDPYFNPSPRGRGSSEGSIAHRPSRGGSLGTRPEYSDGFRDRVRSYCHRGDPVCQGAIVLNPLKPFQDHTNYADTGEASDAARWLSTRLRPTLEAAGGGTDG